MIEAPSLSYYRRAGLPILAGLTLCLQSPLVAAPYLVDLPSIKNVVTEGLSQPLQLKPQAEVSYDAYILGPGDELQIELLDLPELSGNFSIGPDGSIYLPRLRALYVGGLTIEELRTLLTRQFSYYVRDPKIYIRPVAYRPVRVYVGGEVKRPGYYTLNGDTKDVNQKPGQVLYPTVFDAIRSAQGITPFTDLSKVQVIRKRAKGIGGGQKQTNLNFLSLITEGNESQNIRLFDGDILKISKSPVVLRDQLLKAGQSNLSPQYMEVFITGRVKIPGGVKLPQGSTLNQAIALAGGTELLKGKVEFVRFSREGTIDRRIFSYRPGAMADSQNNPVLAGGDLIRVNESILTGSLNVINELTSPFVSLFSFYSLVKNISE